MVNDGITMAGATEPILSDEQKARGQALIIARDILAQKGGGPFASVSLSNASVFDVIALATWVLDGKNPLEGEVVDFDGGDEEEQSDDGNVGAKPGDIVRLTFDDHSSRLYTNTGQCWYSPEVLGKFDTPHVVQYDRGDIVSVQVVARLGETLS